jgi:arylformamidase
MIDITRALTSGHPNWPGDAPFSLTPTTSIAEGSSVNLMALGTSTHCGTHLDAPFHYLERGARLASVPLELLLGDALVVAIDGATDVTPAQLPEGRLPERVLFATGQPDRWDRFPEAFTPLTPELIYHLADRGVRLVGTDAPSVDRFDSRELPVHAACGARAIAIVEGLRLGGVTAGSYRLICLPLHLPEADASPVRALLLPL